MLTETQQLLLLAIFTVAMTFVMIWMMKIHDRKYGIVDKERYSTKTYTNANDWTSDRPYPAYVSILDNEGAYKYIDEYVQALQGDPFKNFPPTDNYTTRLNSYLRSAST